MLGLAKSQKEENPKMIFDKIIKSIANIAHGFAANGLRSLCSLDSNQSRRKRNQGRVNQRGMVLNGSLNRLLGLSRPAFIIVGIFMTEGMMYEWNA